MMIALFVMTRWQDGKIDELKAERDSLTDQLSEQVAINKDYQDRAQKLHELDTRHTQELTNAKTEIDSLRDAVKSGTKRVYIKAECPKVGADTAASMDDATAIRLARDAEPDYFHLRSQLETMDAQVRGLQDYIKTQCLQ